MQRPRVIEEIDGSISMLITSDEEGPSINGTRKVLAWMKDQGERPDHCTVGEPTNAKRIGESRADYPRPRRLPPSCQQSDQGAGEDPGPAIRLSA